MCRWRNEDKIIGFGKRRLKDNWPERVCLGMPDWIIVFILRPSLYDVHFGILRF